MTLLALCFAFGCSAQAADQTATADKAAEPAVDVAAVDQAIDAANAKFVEAIKAGDAASAAANYDAEAIVMLPNVPAMTGAAAISEGLKQFLAEASVKEMAFADNQVIPAGDLAIETGSGQWTLQPPKGAATTDKFKYVTVWKRQADGSWKILRDINNSDLPLPGSK